MEALLCDYFLWKADTLAHAAEYVAKIGLVVAIEPVCWELQLFSSSRFWFGNPRLRAIEAYWESIEHVSSQGRAESHIIIWSTSSLFAIQGNAITALTNVVSLLAQV